MNPGSSSTVGGRPRALLAKLVIVTSALVALASSAPPRWFVQQQGQLQLVFDERDERTLMLSIELSGGLYAAAEGATLELVTTADRAAGDLTLSARPLPADATLSEATEADPVASANPELGANNGVATTSPDLRSPTMAWLSIPIECAQAQPSRRRPKTCVEQLELTLTRAAQKPLIVAVSATVYVDGPGQSAPPGTLQVSLAESAP